MGVGFTQSVHMKQWFYATYDFLLICWYHLSTTLCTSYNSWSFVEKIYEKKFTYGNNRQDFAIIAAVYIHVLHGYSPMFGMVKEGYSRTDSGSHESPMYM